MAAPSTNCVFTPTSTTTLTAQTWHMRAAGYRDTRDAALSEEHIPWGNSNVMQLGGRQFRKVSMSGVFSTDTTVDALSSSYVGERGTLIWPRGSSTGETAVLEGIEEGDATLAGGLVMATLKFTVGST